MNQDFDNPYRAPETLPEPVISSPPEEKWLKRLIGLQILTSIAGAGIAVMEIETILFTGPILTVLGTATAVFARRVHWRLAALLGVSGPAISLFCFALIVINDWGPDKAQRPISGIAIVYAGLAAIAAIVATGRQRMVPGFGERPENREL